MTKQPASVTRLRRTAGGLRRRALRADVSEREADRLYQRAARLDKEAAAIMERRRRDSEACTVNAKAWA